MPSHATPTATRFQERLNYQKLFWNGISGILLSIFHFLANYPAKICAFPITPSPPKYHHWKLKNYSTLQNTTESLSNLILGDEVFLAEYYSVHTKTTKYPASRHSQTLYKNPTGTIAGEKQQRPMMLKRGAWDWHRETETGTTATGRKVVFTG